MVLSADLYFFLPLAIGCALLIVWIENQTPKNDGN